MQILGKSIIAAVLTIIVAQVPNVNQFILEKKLARKMLLANIPKGQNLNFRKFIVTELFDSKHCKAAWTKKNLPTPLCVGRGVITFISMVITILSTI